MAIAKAVPGKTLLNHNDHTLIMIDHQSQMSFATKSIDAVTLRNNAALVAKAAKEFGVSTANRAQLYKDLASGPFFGFNLEGATPSAGLIDTFWMQGMMAGHKNTYDCIAAFSATDFTEDLLKFDIPTLIIHGDADQVVPIGASALAAARLVRDAVLKVYAGAPHGLTDTHKDQLNADLLAFIQS